MTNIYVFQHGQDPLFKIGRTRNSVKQRLRCLATGNPIGLALRKVYEVDDAREIESMVHDLLRERQERHIGAKEFFRIDSENWERVIDELYLKQRYMLRPLMLRIPAVR